MTNIASFLRLVRDDEPVPEAPSTGPGPLPPAGANVNPALTQVETLQAEIATLSREINYLRRRDETLNFYMHRLDEELRLAARLQQDFLPKSLPQVGRINFHTLYRPCGYVSGDLYDVMRLDETHVAFYICDAVGHGMPAALLTMFLKNALATKEITPNGYRLLPPNESLARVNNALVDQNLSQATFATAVYGIVDTTTLWMSVARAGHPCPILTRRDGSTEMINADGGLLGIFRDETYAEAFVQLTPGDRLFIYTDGMEVAFSDGQNIDLDRWKEELQQRRGMSTEQLLEDFASHLDQQSGSLEPKDDLTMLVLEVN